MSVLDALKSLQTDATFSRDVTAWQRAPEQLARFADYPRALRPELVAALRQRGYEQPYSHQASAIEAALRGENVVVVANAAGGKSMCFHAPIVNALLSDSQARGLCLFPTKALAQDQLAAFRALLDALPPSSLGTRSSSLLVSAYDGDTPQSQRADIRRDARIVVSNADMLHIGVLPHHTRWANFFKNLKFVVIDELHAYRGIFGSHVANVVRRLKRVCEFYGARPVFILASATIANPKAHAERLIESPVTLVDDDGSPHGERHVIVVNPPIVDAEMGLRRSSTFIARDIAARFVVGGLQTICFARSRQDTELLLTYLRSTDVSRQRPTTIAGYRGGYLPEERRAIEKGLRDGAIRAVVATNALELGIDVGELDACVMLGYPGSIASFWQQAGRAGRRRQASVAVMVASATALDQYLAAHSDYLFRQSPEFARIDPDNLGVLAAHVGCAAFELPFVGGEKLGRADVAPLLEALVEEGEIHASDVGGLPMFREQAPDAGHRRYTWVGDGYPADRVSLRGVGERIVIVDEAGRLVGETERSTASGRVYVGAVYMHQAEQYQIVALDWEAGRAAARKVNVDYFTDASVVLEIIVLREFDADASAPDADNAASPRAGEMEVRSRAVRYRQVQFDSHRTLNWGDIDLPEQTLLTMGYWFSVPADMAKKLAKEGVIKLPNDYGPNWQKQRNLARERDGYRCTVCGRPEFPNQQHDVHHKKPFRTFGYVPGENDAYLRANELENLVTVCRDCHRTIETAESTRTALEGLANLIGNLAPLFVMCDPADLAVNADWHSAHTRLPTITLYELAPGGTGLCDELLRHHAALLDMAAERIRECGCERGCPACVGPGDEREDGRDLKADTLRLIAELARTANSG